MNRIAVVALTVTIAACAGPRSEQGSPSSPQGRNAATASSDAARAVGAQAAPSAEQGMSAICPMDVPGTTVAASDTPDGEAITFTTTSGQVDELRRRVHALADMHNDHMSSAPAATASSGVPGTTPGGVLGTGSGGGAAPEAAGHPDHPMMPHSRAKVDDVDNGARVSISALDPAHVDQLRSAVRAHATQMARAGCGMAHPAGPRG